jgi:hypothetical protein
MVVASRPYAGFRLGGSLNQRRRDHTGRELRFWFPLVRVVSGQFRTC